MLNLINTNIMKRKILSIALLTTLMCSSIYGKFISQSPDGLSGLAEDNAISLLALDPKVCMKKDGAICYQYIATPDGPPEAEYAKGWVNRYEVIE